MFGKGGKFMFGGMPPSGNGPGGMMLDTGGIPVGGKGNGGIPLPAGMFAAGRILARCPQPGQSAPRKG